jgi:hypothetical protein
MARDDSSDDREGLLSKGQPSGYGSASGDGAASSSDITGNTASEFNSWLGILSAIFAGMGYGCQSIEGDKGKGLAIILTYMGFSVAYNTTLYYPAGGEFYSKFTKNIASVDGLNRWAASIKEDETFNVYSWEGAKYYSLWAGETFFGGLGLVCAALPVANATLAGGTYLLGLAGLTGTPATAIAGGAVALPMLLMRMMLTFNNIFDLPKKYSKIMERINTLQDKLSECDEGSKEYYYYLLQLFVTKYLSLLGGTLVGAGYTFSQHSAGGGALEQAGITQLVWQIVAEIFASAGNIPFNVFWTVFGTDVVSRIFFLTESEERELEGWQKIMVRGIRLVNLIGAVFTSAPAGAPQNAGIAEHAKTLTPCAEYELCLALFSGVAETAGTVMNTASMEYFVIKELVKRGYLPEKILDDYKQPPVADGSALPVGVFVPSSSDDAEDLTSGEVAAASTSFSDSKTGFSGSTSAGATATAIDDSRVTGTVSINRSSHTTTTTRCNPCGWVTNALAWCGSCFSTSSQCADTPAAEA